MNIRLDIKFYNKKEENDFEQNYPNEFTIIEPLVKKGYLKIPYEDFQTYFLFKHQFDSHAPDFFRVQNLKLFKNWGIFEDYFEFDKTKEKFYSKTPSSNGNPEISESVGIAGALSASSNIFLNITQADWRKIPVLKTKDFDFNHLASDGKKYIIVESKGSMVIDNTNHLDSSLQSHKTGIHKKKIDPNFKSKYSRATDFFYGVITATDMSNHVVARFVDPPLFSEIPMSPSKYKLLARLYYYFDYVRIISSRSHIALLLANRLRDITESDSYEQFDGRVLMNSSFESLSISESFIHSKSYSEDKNTIGKVQIVDNDKLLFIGLHRDIFDIIIKQNFSQISAFKVISSTQTQTLICRLNAKDYENNIFMKSLNLQIKAKDGFYRFKAEIDLIKCSSGLTYGEIPKNKITL